MLESLTWIEVFTYLESLKYCGFYNIFYNSEPPEEVF